MGFLGGSFGRFCLVGLIVGFWGLCVCVCVCVCMCVCVCVWYLFYFPFIIFIC